MFYIYQHVRNDNGQIFYVGKGQGDRAKSKERNPFWKNVFKKAGGFSIDYFMKDIKDEDKAYEIEIARIAELRNQGVELTNISEGGEGFASGENHPSYGKHRTDLDIAKVKLGQLKKSSQCSVTKRFKNGKTIFCVRGSRGLARKGQLNSKELGSFYMKHEAIAVAKAERERLISELTTYISEVENNQEPSKSLEEILDVQEGMKELGYLKREWAIIKSQINACYLRDDIEKAKEREDYLLVIQDLILELNSHIQTCRTYEEELNLQYFYADKYLKQGNDHLYERALANIISLEKEQAASFKSHSHSIGTPKLLKEKYER